MVELDIARAQNPSQEPRPMHRFTTLCVAALSTVSTAIADPEFELAFVEIPSFISIEDVALIPRGDIAVGYFSVKDSNDIASFAFNEAGRGPASVLASFPGAISGLATNADRAHVYVIEHRLGDLGAIVHVLNTDGIPLMDIIPEGDPVFGTGLDCDRYGNVFLTDPGGDRVLVFDESWFVPANYGTTYIATPDLSIGPLLYSNVVDVSCDFWGSAHLSFEGGEVAIYDATGSLWSLGGTGGIDLGSSASGIDAHTFQPGTLAPSTWVGVSMLREIDWDLVYGTPSMGQALGGVSNGVESITLNTDSGPIDMLLYVSDLGIYAYRR